MTNPSYDDIRQQISRRFGRLSLFIFHVIMAITTTAVIWLIDPTPQDGTPVLAGLWLGVLVWHATKVYMDGVRDREIERTWQRYSGDLVDIDEKPKRMMRLADDDELEVVEDEAANLRRRR
jgi:hypothetical protein